MALLDKEQMTAALQKGTQTLVKHSPKILTAAGIAGFFTTVIFAVKSKGKADLLVNEALEQKKADAQEKLDNGEELEVPVESIKLTPFEKVKAVTPAYWPTAAMFVLSSAAVIGSDVISDKRQVALTAAYSIADASLKEYQKKKLKKMRFVAQRLVRNSRNSLSVLRPTNTSRITQSIVSSWLLSRSSCSLQRLTM